MAAPTFLFEILTPQKTVYSGRVSSLVGPAAKGSFGILANHAPLVAESSGGKLKIREESRVAAKQSAQQSAQYQDMQSSKTASETERNFLVGPGFFEVLKNRVILLTKKVEVISPAN